MRNFETRFTIKERFYILLEILKATVLIIFFLYELYLIKRYNGWEVFPHNKFELLLLTTYLIFIILAWILGERRKTFLVFVYFATFQIIGLAFILKDATIIPRILIPVFLVYLTLFLFKSPAEFIRDKNLKRYKQVLKRLENLKSKLKLYENNLKLLKEEYRNLLKEREQIKEIYEKEKLKPLRDLLEQKTNLLNEYTQKIKELEEKIIQLRRNNDELWNILEEIDKSSDPRKELKQLRKERKKLIKENLNLKQSIEELNRKIELLEKENLALKSSIGDLKGEIKNLTFKLETYKEEIDKLTSALNKNFTDYLNLILDKVKLTPQALADLEGLSSDFLIKTLKALKRLDKTAQADERKFEVLNLKNRNIYKYKLSGGRIYFSIEDGIYRILGILEGEDDKTKNRFIRERFG